MNINFRYINFVILMMFCVFDSFSQTGSVKGKILTSDGGPAAAVSVQLRELRKGTITNEDGSYKIIQVEAGSYTLLISFVGLQTIERKIEVGKGELEMPLTYLAENSNQLQEIVVIHGRGMNEKRAVAAKLNIHPMDLPQSVTVVGKELLERQQVQQLSDALQNVTGVYVMGATGGYQEEIAGRGFSFGSSNTFKNGSRYNNGAMPEMSGVEKIEFLKGSNAILYGNVAAGGILNIITKKPKFERGGEISFRTGSYDLYKTSVDFYGGIDDKQNLAFRINSSYQQNGSFRNAVKGDRFYINPSFLIHLSPKTELLIEGDFMKDERTPDYGTGAIDYTIATVPRNRFLGVEWGRVNAEQRSATATINHNLNRNWQVKAMTSIQSYEMDLFAAARPTGIKADGTWIRGLQKSRTDENYMLAQLDLTGKFKTGKIGHTILIGADADQYKTISHAFVNNRYNSGSADVAIRKINVYDTVNIFNAASFGRRNDIPFLATDRITTSPVARVGVYVQDLVALSEKFKMLAGIRYSYQDNREVKVDSVAKGSTGVIASFNNDAFSPRLGLVFQPTKQVSVFVSYTNSFSVNSGIDINNENLPPSIIDQYEMGLKTDLLKGLISANLTLYQIVNDNFAQTAIFMADGITPNTNSNVRELNGEVTSKGVELDLTTRPIKGFSLIAGYSFNETKYTGGNGKNFKTGDRLRYNPSHTANAHVFYTFDGTSDLKGLNLGMGAYFVGDRLAGRNPSALSPQNKLMALPDYTLFDASVGYNIKQFSLRFKLTNLLNQLSYNVHDDNSVNPIAPRQFASTLTYKF